ncbi:MAG: hypothetical protein J1G30_01190 [Spirochaetales bacterium]|nr:hypothetical protein [Spirochaetales bacterium]
MAKMGRPTEAPKTEWMKMRLTAQQAKDLKFCADTLKTTKTDILIMGLEEVKKKIER